MSATFHWKLTFFLRTHHRLSYSCAFKSSRWALSSQASSVSELDVYTCCVLQERAVISGTATVRKGADGVTGELTLKFSVSTINLVGASKVAARIIIHLGDPWRIGLFSAGGFWSNYDLSWRDTV